MQARVGTCISVTTGKSCTMSLKRKRFSSNAAPNIGQNCQTIKWPIILGAGLYTTFHGKQVLVVITCIATFLSWGVIVKKYIPWMMQKV